MASGAVLALALLAGNPPSGAGASPPGAVLDATGASFTVWAPHASAVTVRGSFNFWSATASPLVRGAGGIWSGHVDFAKAGDEYLYHIIGPHGALDRIDPAADEVTTARYGVGRTILYDQTAFAWGNDASFQPAAERDLIIYEMHIGTYDAPVADVPGTFADAAARLDHVAALGATAVEVLPVNESPGLFFTGYGPAEIDAVDRDAYGGPDGFKAFVQAAHRQGLAVILDIVHNHWGPWDLETNQFDGWYTKVFSGGIYFYDAARINSPWGPRPDYAAPEVRDTIVDSVRRWVTEDHVDGFRWDSTSNIDWTDSGSGIRLPEGWALMRQANAMLHRRFPRHIAIAEDFLDRDSITASLASGGAGFDSQWSYLVSPLRAALTAASDAKRQLPPVVSAMQAIYNDDAWHRVVYSESHNEVSPPGARLTVQIDPTNPASWAARKLSTLGAVIAYTSPGIPMLWEGQEFLDPNQFDPHRPLDWRWLQHEPGIFALYQDLLALRRDRTGTTEGLRGTHLDVFHVDNVGKLLAYWRWDAGGARDDCIVVANFSGVTVQAIIGLPRTGVWTTRFDTDDRRYSPDYGDGGSRSVEAAAAPADGLAASGVVVVPPYSALVLSED